MKNNNEFILRKPLPSDGRDIWELVKKSQSLDLNSLYFYILMSYHFGNSSIIALYQNKIAGCVISYFPPDNQKTLFVWQVCVAKEFKGKGLAKQMICTLAKQKSPNKIKYIEATITPSNKASIALFTAVAKNFGAKFAFENEIFPKDFFQGCEHEPEKLFHIGPLN